MTSSSSFVGTLKVTDGTPENTVTILARKNGVSVQNWRPQTGQAKEGAVFANSQYMDGRQMVARNWANITDTFESEISGADMNDAISTFNKLLRLLILAGSYWISDYQVGEGAAIRPFWVEALGECETNPRYAYIYDGTIPELANPHDQPFAASPSSTDLVNVIIEHGVWRSNPPGEADCLKTSSYVTKPGLASEISVPEIANDVAWVDTVAMARLGATDEFGWGGGNDGFSDFEWEAGVRVRDVDVPQGAKILNAYFVGANLYPSVGVITISVDVYGESNMTPAAFSDYADFIARTPTTATVNWPISEVIIVGKLMSSPDLEPIITELISNPAWVSGNDIVLLFKDPVYTPTSAITLAGFNHATYDPAYLYIAYEVDDVQYGIYIPVCMNNYATGYQVDAQTDFVAHYDDSTGVYTVNLNTGPYPYDLFPDPLGVGDRLYIGSDFPFSNFEFNLGNGGDGTVTYEYHYSTTGGIAGGTLTNPIEYDFGLFEGVANTGFMSVVFSRPNNWAKNLLGTLPSKYWIVIEITAVTIAPNNIPTQQTQPIYTTAWPFWEVADDEIGGSIPALLKFLLVNINTLDGAGDPHGYNHFLFGLRHYLRGADYTPFLNVQANPSGMSFAAGGTATTPDNSLAPSGKSLNYSVAVATADATLGTWSLSGSAFIKQYYGRYRVFVRMRITAGALGVAGFTFRLVESSSGNTVLFETTRTFTSIAATGYDLLDLGFMTFRSAGGLVYSAFDFVLRCVTSGAFTADILDVILFPADEGTLEISSDGILEYDDADYPGNQLFHDSTKPKELAYSGVVDANEDLVYRADTNCLGLYVIDEKARMRIYFLPWNDGDGELKGTEGLFDCWFERVQQYLNMRGDE